MPTAIVTVLEGLRLVASHTSKLQNVVDLLSMIGSDGNTNYLMNYSHFLPYQFFANLLHMPPQGPWPFLIVSIVKHTTRSHHLAM